MGPAAPARLLRKKPPVPKVTSSSSSRLRRSKDAQKLYKQHKAAAALNPKLRVRREKQRAKLERAYGGAFF
jgi:hypothetical protein